jgi:hypothetical protein
VGSDGVAEDIDFGTVEVGGDTTHAFSIVNTGEGRMRGEVDNTICADFSVIGGGGTYSLGENETHAVTVSFHPESAGEKSCLVDIGSDCGSVMLTGTGATITVSSPNGGSWPAGLIPISWESANLTGNVAIALSTNCGASFNTIVTDTENDGEQLVNIQQSLNPVLIRVQSLSYPGVSDVSNASFCTHGPQFVCTPAPCP